MSSLESCISNLGFSGTGSKLFETHAKCGNTHYQKTSEIGACFLQQYALLSQYAAESCIPHNLHVPFMNCMASAKSIFLTEVSSTYKKLTLRDDGNTLGAGFEKTALACTHKVLPGECPLPPLHPTWGNVSLSAILISIAVVGTTGWVIHRRCCKRHLPHTTGEMLERLKQPQDRGVWIYDSKTTSYLRMKQEKKNMYSIVNDGKPITIVVNK